MASGADLTLDISFPTNRVLILSYTDSDRSLKLLYERFPSIRSNRVRLTTRYFNADIPFHMKTVTQPPGLLDNLEFVQSLQTVPAVVIVSNTCDDIPDCQRVWSNIKNSVREDAARVLLLFEDLSSRENQNLIEWAAVNAIEIVSRYSCEGDSVSQRLLEILACAPWRILSKPAPSCNGAEKADTNTERLKEQANCSYPQKLEGQERSASEVVSSEVGDETILDLSKATRLRRGLRDKDISNILDDLLLADSDGDDSE